MYNENELSYYYSQYTEAREEVRQCAATMIPGVFKSNNEILFIADSAPYEPLGDKTSVVIMGGYREESPAGNQYMDKDVIIQKIITGKLIRLPEKPSFYIFNSNFAKLREFNITEGQNDEIFPIEYDDTSFVSAADVSWIGDIQRLYPLHYMLQFRDDKWNAFVGKYDNLRKKYEEEQPEFEEGLEIFRRDPSVGTDFRKHFFNWIWQFDRYYINNFPKTTITAIEDAVMDAPTPIDEENYLIGLPLYPEAADGSFHKGESFYITYDDPSASPDERSKTTDPTIVNLIITPKSQVPNPPATTTIVYDFKNLHFGLILKNANDLPFTNIKLHRFRVTNETRVMPLFMNSVLHLQATEREEAFRGLGMRYKFNQAINRLSAPFKKSMYTSR